jgi:hypothetical protein
MPKKGIIQTREHVDKIRDARFRWLYGENWEASFQALYGPNWRDMSATQRKAMGQPDRAPEGGKQVYEVPLVHGPEFLGKKDFCRLLISRLRDPGIPLAQFVPLAELFAEVRGWKKASRAMKRVPQHSDTRSPLVMEGTSFNEQIQALEQQQRESHG